MSDDNRYTPLPKELHTHDAGVTPQPVVTEGNAGNYAPVPINQVQTGGEDPQIKHPSAYSANDYGLVGAGLGLTGAETLNTAKLAGEKLGIVPQSLQRYADTQIGHKFNLPLEALKKEAGVPYDLETYPLIQRAIKKVSGSEAVPDAYKKVYTVGPNGKPVFSHMEITPGTPEVPPVDLSKYKRTPMQIAKHFGELPVRAGVAGYDIGRGLSDPTSIGGLADIGAGISAAAAPLLKGKAKTIANVAGALPIVGGLIPGASAAPLKPHEVAGTAVDLATGWMSPTELGKGTTQPENEAYYPGMTGILHGTTLPPGHAEGGDIKKSPASIAGTLQEVGTVQGPSLASKWAEHLASLPQTTEDNLRHQQDVMNRAMPISMNNGKLEFGQADPEAMREMTDMVSGIGGMTKVVKDPIINALSKVMEPIKKSGAQLAREAEYVHDVRPTHNFSEAPKISIQDLQGGYLVGVPGDRSLAGHSLVSVNGVPLSKDTGLYGGPRYGQRKSDLGEDTFWASKSGAATALQNKARRAAELAGDNPVFGMYTAMAPDSSNFALHHTEALVNQLDALNPNKAKLRAFDNMIRDSYPEFLGMNHPEVMNQFAANSELRKHVADRLNKTKIVAQYDMPSGEATIHAITDPSLRNVKTGSTGYSVGELNPFASLTSETEHPTYDTKIPGKFKGQMIAQLPWEHYFPDAAKQIAADPKQAPYAWGTFKMGDYNQPVTQELVDKIAPIEEMVKSAAKDFGYENAVKQMAAPTTAAAPAVNRINMNYKDVTKRIPELQESAQQIMAGTGSREAHEALVNTHKPVLPFDFVPKPATPEEAIGALSADKKDLYGVPSKTLQAGHPVGLRLDIPAYSNHGVWVPTVHEQASGFGAGKAIGHESVASVLNPQFGMSDKAALSIASGKPKGTIATIKGNWNPVDQEQAVANAQEYLNHPDWRQVGMDPERHGYFYDRETMEPITHAEEALQIGPLVLAKKPVYGNKEDFKFADGGLAHLR